MTLSSRTMSRIVAGLCLLGLQCSQESKACLQVIPNEHVVDETLAQTDQDPPQIEDISIFILRAPVPVSTGCGSHGNHSCPQAGFTLDITYILQDHESPKTTGYILERVAGTYPRHPDAPAVRNPSRRSLIWSGPAFWYSWYEPGPDEQETVDLTLDVFPIDAAGNIGEPFRVRIFDPVEQPSCSTQPTAPRFELSWFVLLGILYFWRRSHRAQTKTTSHVIHRNS